jgi:hypothetical protein
MSKPRSDSLYARLKPAQREQLLLHLNSGGAIDAAVTLAGVWGVKTSIGAVSQFYQVHCFEWQLGIAKAAAKTTEDCSTFEAETSRVLAQKTFEALLKTDIDPKVLVALARLEADKQQRELEREKFKASLRTKLEAGMEALKTEIQKNPKALKAFEDLQGALAK